MDDIDSVTTVSSTKSSIDSGFDNGFLSDSSSSSSKSDYCLPSCLFEETTKGKINSKYPSHYCALNVYNKSGCCIETMSPRTFAYLGNCVRVLDLSKNKIKNLPETISELNNLQELNLSFNELHSLPDSCQRLQKLEMLNLTHNQLTEPPPCLELGMQKLTHLDLSGNMISNFPNPPKCSLSLQILNLSHNNFNLLPLWLFKDQCRSIVELDVSFNFCFDDPQLRSQLPLLKHHRTSTLKSLKKLRICNTGINRELISPLSSFESLQSLHMGNLLSSGFSVNQFSEISVNLLCNPCNIVELYLPQLGLAGLPEDFDRFQNLEVLDVSHNPLDWLPETFGSLKSLRELTLSDCNLSYLPENFSQLKSLEKLILDCNKISDIHGSLNGLSNLEWLDIYNNLLEELPISPELLQNLHLVDLDCNYIDLEVVLNIEVNGEKPYDVYCRKRAKLREANRPNQHRSVGFRVNSPSRSWDSEECLHRRYYSDSSSDVSQTDDNVQDCIIRDEDLSEENWDEDTNNDSDVFEPDSIYRYQLPLGQYKLGWTPPIKRRACTVPINLQVNGFIYIPGQFHQKTTIKKLKKHVKDLPVVEGQFSDAAVDIADLQSADSLGELLRRMYMFVRNPGGMRCKRRCKFHSIYEDCLHHGLWYQLSPPVNFETPDDEVDI